MILAVDAIKQKKELLLDFDKKSSIFFYFNIRVISLFAKILNPHKPFISDWW